MLDNWCKCLCVGAWKHSKLILSENTEAISLTCATLDFFQIYKMDARISRQIIYVLLIHSTMCLSSEWDSKRFCKVPRKSSWNNSYKPTPEKSEHAITHRKENVVVISYEANYLNAWWCLFCWDMQISTPSNYIGCITISSRNPQFLLCTCWSILGQDTERQITPDGQANALRGSSLSS